MRNFCVIFIIIFIAITVTNAEMVFKSSEEKEVYNSFSDNELNQRLKQTNVFLNDFKKLTEKYLKEKYGKKWHSIYSSTGVKGINNTGWEMQTIGFANIPKYIAGSLLKKRYRISMLEYKLAEYRLRNKEIDIKEFNMKKKMFEKMEKEMKTFLSNMILVD